MAVNEYGELGHVKADFKCIDEEDDSANERKIRADPNIIY
jgi:hypothetical protein